MGLLLIISCEENDLGESEQPNILDNRDYILYKPVNLPANAPLVFVLHGYTSSAEIIEWYSGMNDLADENGFAVCYPQGTEDYGGTTHWNSHLTISQTDDIEFLTALAIFLQNKHSLNPEKTFVCGMSNGGYMSYALACEASETFKAMASVTGTMSGKTWEKCQPENPVSVLQISGVEDKVVPIDGSMAPAGGWGGAPHMDSIITYWSNQNECTSVDSIFFPSSTQAYYYKNCSDNHEVWYYKIDNWGHQWPTEKDGVGTIANEVIWEFFEEISID